MLKIGDSAPEFELLDENSASISLVSLLADGQPLILYFYPADFTPACTMEACSIRDIHDDILGADLKVVGVSPQSVASHQRFKTSHKLPFPLLFDEGKKVVRAYGVDGPMGFGVRRTTFLINAGKKIMNRVNSEFFVGSHIKFIEAAIQSAT